MQTEYYFDFAGSGVVHLLGATCSIIGCYFMGPRIGRFEVTHQHFIFSLDSPILLDFLVGNKCLSAFCPARFMKDYIMISSNRVVFLQQWTAPGRPPSDKSYR